MGHSSLLGTEPAPQEPEGRDNAVLGPSDSSDSGSDRAGLPDQADSDAAGTGESRGVGNADTVADAADIGVDRVFTPGRRRRMKSDAGERLHDDEDSDLDFVDTATAPDPLDDEEPGGMDEDDNIPGSGSEGGQPGAPPADRPDPAPEPTEKPQPGDGGGEQPADEKDQREKQPGRARQLLRRLVRSAA